MSLHIVRRTRLEPADFGAELHPVLERAYAARGLRSARDLDISLARLLPVGTLEGVPEAVFAAVVHDDRANQHGE